MRKLLIKSTQRTRYGKWHDIEVEDDVTAYFEYESGATGVFITTTGEMSGTNRFEVSGTKGKRINGVELMNAIELSGWNDGELIKLPIDENRYLRELEKHKKRSKYKKSNHICSADAIGELAQRYFSNNHSISEIIKK